MKYSGRAGLALVRGMRNPEKYEEHYKEVFSNAVATSKRIATQDIPFRKLVDQNLDLFGEQMDDAIAIVGTAGLARRRLAGMFKDDNVEDLLIALEIDLNGNPTAEMGHQMFALAQFPEVQETDTGEQFAEKLANQEFSSEFQQAYSAYMDRFGCRTIREIDIATERPYENVPAFFEQLKAMDVQSDMLAQVAQRRSDTYDQLLTLAQQKGKEEQFKKQALLLSNYGYREAPKYFFIVTLDLMRRRALAWGEALVAQGQLDATAQVFDLTVD